MKKLCKRNANLQTIESYESCVCSSCPALCTCTGCGCSAEEESSARTTNLALFGTTDLDDWYGGWVNNYTGGK